MISEETTYEKESGFAVDDEPEISHNGQSENLTGEPKKKQQIEFHPFAPYKGMGRRLFLIYKHIVGLLAGGLIAYVNDLPPERKKRLRTPGKRFLAFWVKPFVKKELRNVPFPVQLRKRLELLGPTYVKFGQIMSIREDLLPVIVTNELKNLLDRLPEVPFPQIKKIIEDDLGQPVETLFHYINEQPLASASIAQTHLAKIPSGELVVLKVIKPGIRSSILTDIKLLKLVSGLLEFVFPRYQPKMIINEFCAYTEKEVDLTYEADNAELFAANFADDPYVVFPKIYRGLSTKNVLCMEYFDGFKPGDPETQELSLTDRKKLIDYGTKAIIKMLYEDGFFHADLHPANLIILPGPKVGFIDLGMVGRFDDKTRRYLLYYFNALVNDDIEGSTKYLLSIAKVGEGGDKVNFRRAVNDLFRRYSIYSAMGQFSMGKLILESLQIGGAFKIFFPVEMTLMVKALVTFEGVGVMLDPKLDILAVSKKHISQIYLNQYSPKYLGRELLRSAPEFVDALVHLPQLSSDVARYVENSLNDHVPQNPMAGVRSGIIAGSCIIGGVMALIQGAPIYLWIPLFAVGIVLAIAGK